MNVDGSGEFRLTDNAASDVNPAWSPDGTRIAFMSTRDGDPEIYLMNTDGGDVQRLTTSAGSDTSPVWSPDGTKIAFVSERDGNPDIFVMSADGAQPRNLTQQPARDVDPAWSPDGARIVFASYRDAPADKPAANDLYLMQADGSGVTRLTNDLARNGAPKWSPDGSRIAFDFFDGEGVVDGDVAGGDVYLINADGSGQQRLTDDTTGGRQPSWSGDGTRIVFASARNDASTFDLFTVGADGANVTQLTTNAANDAEPAYAPDPQAARPGDTEASYNGVSFRSTTTIADGVAGQVVARNQHYDTTLPAYTEFTFVNPRHTGTLQSWLRVFPVDELRALPPEFAEAIDALEPMPPLRAARILRVQEQPLKFVNGDGKRAVVQYSQSVTALTNADLFYTYQGLTDDGKYYVSLAMPVAAPDLPASMDVVLRNEVPALPYDANNQEAFNSAVERFNAEATTQVAALDPAAFTPSLTALDDLVRSLKVE